MRPRARGVLGREVEVICRLRVKSCRRTIGIASELWGGGKCPVEIDSVDSSLRGSLVLFGGVVFRMTPEPEKPARCELFGEWGRTVGGRRLERGWKRIVVPV
jgi:hypothetical protein